MDSTLAPGQTFAGYRIDGILGRGGMSVVYRVWDVALERPVALKVVAPELAGDSRFRERFLRESRLAAWLEHPHVLPVYVAGEHDGSLFLAMRLVDGEDLGTRLDRVDRLELDEAIGLVAQLADALDAAHAKGLVHRDAGGDRGRASRSVCARLSALPVPGRPAFERESEAQLLWAI